MSTNKWFIKSSTGALFAGFEYTGDSYRVIWSDFGQVVTMKELEAYQVLRMMGGADKAQAEIVVLSYSA